MLHSKEILYYTPTVLIYRNGALQTIQYAHLENYKEENIYNLTPYNYFYINNTLWN